MLTDMAVRKARRHFRWRMKLRFGIYKNSKLWQQMITEDLNKGNLIYLKDSYCGRKIFLYPKISQYCGIIYDVKNKLCITVIYIRARSLKNKNLQIVYSN